MSNKPIPYILVEAFLNRKSRWFNEPSNSMYGCRERVENFLLTFDVEKMECGDDYGESNLIVAEGSFRSFVQDLRDYFRELKTIKTDTSSDSE
jgi:hypothetical protein